MNGNDGVDRESRETGEIRETNKFGQDAQDSWIGSRTYGLANSECRGANGYLTAKNATSAKI